LISDCGYEVELLPYTVQTVPDYQSMRGLVHKRLRWIVVMRYMRPWGHLGLLLTQGLPWSIAAILSHPTWGVALTYLGLYFALRVAITAVIGVWGLKQTYLWKRMLLIPLWDGLAFGIWLLSFLRKSVRWRDGKYYIRNGMLVPAAPQPVGDD
jgi:ceramide glucosyltransferase